jgi:3-hydroxyisobutyrate dehydrogenase-like beta-hydroxyacid dehydrogenase
MSASAGAVGVVGLGQIGGGVARALAARGWSVVGFDVSAEAYVRLGDAVVPATSPGAVAACAEVVLVAVLDDHQVRSVLSGEGGIASGGFSGLTVVVLSTVDVQTIEWAAELGRAHGFEVVDCGVTGGSRAAAEGTLVAMLGGDEAAVAAALLVVEDFSSRALHVGSLGSGLRLKLARNLVTYGSWMVADEAARLIAASGIDAASLVEVIRASDPLTGGVTGMLDGDRPGRPAPAALAAIADKDLRAALSLAERSGVDLPVTRLVTDRIGGLVGADSSN